ncbi:hypothetical protein NLJ89_g5240 [Agrocybe chaxingu]|uniref:Uncharacterized protein n=1 Tax=Agrocybe chaxingu TaxID=84603 RepID=A0A9W8K0Z8_9AGAR|nr:hypothetical protein NLJ89_g5240 [Agrocybe chaxingu]
MVSDATAFAFGHVDSPLDKEDYVDVKLVFDSVDDREGILLEDVPAVLEVPKAVVAEPVREPEPTTQQLLRVHLEQFCVTPSKASIVGDADFSIYTPVSSPSKKAMYISPMRSPILTMRDVNFTVLKAASDHVAEILRENRRRVDAGEDSNAARREARRKRAQELAARKNRTDL